MHTRRILHANDDNHNLGGAFIITYNVEKYLRNFGYSYDYITMDHFDSDSDYVIDKDRKIFSANLRSNKLLGHIQLPFYVDSVLKENKYSLIHIDTDSAWKALLYAIPAKKNNVKVLVHSHSTGIDGEKKYLKLACEVIAKRLLTRYCDAYIACSADAAKWIVPNFTRENVDVIPNGIDLNKFYYSEEERIRTRNQYGIEKSVVIGNVGLFSENKNQKYLIYVLDKMLEKNYDIKLLLVGDDSTNYGKQMKNLVAMKQLQDRVIFVGKVHNVRPLMNAMDIYIQPSRFEGFGLVSVEAQATGLTTLISDSLPKESCVSNWAHFFNLNSEIDMIGNEIEKYNRSNSSRSLRKINAEIGLEYMAEREAKIYDELING